MLIKLNIPELNRLFFTTGTPRQDRNVNMIQDTEDDKFGKIISTIDCSTAIQKGYIRNYGIHFSFYKTGEDSWEEAKDDNIKKIILTTSNTLNQYRIVMENRYNRILFFHRFVKEQDTNTSVEQFAKMSQEFSNILGEESVEVGYLDGSMNLEQRRRIFGWFEDDQPIYKILLSCNTISEGIDFPNAQVVCFNDPKSSRIDIAQKLGRILRKQNDSDDRNGNLNNVVSLTND